MAGETQLTIIGNLTADPELRFTQNGLAVVNFTVASTPRVFDRQANEWKDGATLFLRCSAWREFAEQISGNLAKGMRVVVVGNLAPHTYQDREGNSRTTTEMQVLEVGTAIRHRPADGAAVASVQPRQQPQQQPRQQSPQDAWSAPGSFGDDTPF